MIIFDLDGTLANCEHRRHFVDPAIKLRPIASHPNYYAASDGHIYSFNSSSSKKTGIPIKMKGGKQKAGYLFVALYKNDIATYCRIHVLICEAFHGPRPDGLIASHLDDNKINNVPENLKWETASENQLRKFENGHGDDGISNSRSFFKNPEDLILIKNLRSTGLSFRRIAEKFGCSETCIKQICYGKNYKRSVAPQGDFCV